MLKQNMEKYKAMKPKFNLPELKYTIKNIDKTIVNRNCLGMQSLAEPNNLPLLLKKPYLLSNLTSCICLIKKGIPMIAKHNKQSEIRGLLSQHSLSRVNKLIQNQKAKFQKLSLFNRDLIKPIISPMHILKYQNISHIISIFRDCCKVIRLSVAILMIAVAYIQSSFADNVAELINKTEQEYGIPSGLLKSIATVESGNKPYALNISGRSIFASSKEEAVKIVRGLQDQGITNIDLGLAQLNLHWHGEHFKSIEEMFEPKHNIEYAAKFLNTLYRQHGSWNKAVRYYHSANPQHHIKYSRKVLISWLGI